MSTIARKPPRNFTFTLLHSYMVLEILKTIEKHIFNAAEHDGTEQSVRMCRLIYFSSFISCIKIRKAITLAIKA